MNPEILLGGFMVLLLAVGLPIGFIIGPAIRHQFERARAPLMPPHVDKHGDRWFFCGVDLPNGREGKRRWKCIQCRCEKEKQHEKITLSPPQGGDNQGEDMMEYVERYERGEQMDLFDRASGHSKCTRLGPRDRRSPRGHLFREREILEQPSEMGVCYYRGRRGYDTTEPS